MEFNIFTLKNGIRIIHQELPYGEVAHCGFIINVGSRDETPEECGMAHFIEHILFKGTKKRKAFHILNRMDVVGGEINAYTTKEETAIYASFLNAHAERAIELLADITFNATFPEKEINKEKDVVIDEINSYLDDPSDLIFDEFEKMVFDGHQLGLPVLGDKKLIPSFKREHVLQFIDKHYTTNNIVFSFVGAFPLKKLKKYLNKYIEPIPVKNSILKRTPFSNYSPKKEAKKVDTIQAHQLVGNVAYSAVDTKRRGLILLNNLLGGPGLNSRLNLNIREKYGYTYYLESGYIPYSDAGLFNVYFGTDAKHLEKTTTLVAKELKKLREVQLGTQQLHTSKQQLIGQLALSQENKSSMMLAIGKSLLLYNKVDDIRVIYANIESLTAIELQDIANEVFDEKQLSQLTYIAQ